MQPKRHQVVHQVVAAGYAAKYAGDERLLLVNRHAAIAEIGLAVFGVGHGGSLVSTIARRASGRYKVDTPWFRERIENAPIVTMPWPVVS